MHLCVYILHYVVPLSSLLLGQFLMLCFSVLSWPRPRRADRILPTRFRSRRPALVGELLVLGLLLWIGFFALCALTEVVENIRGGGDAAAAAAAVEGRRMARRSGGGGGHVGRRTRRGVEVEAMAIQLLFRACRAMFKDPGTVPAPADVNLLRGILDKMRPEDVGLSSDVEFFKDAAVEETPTILHTTVYKCKNFSIDIFFLPPTASIPLHDHPGMTVFSKLLIGSLHVKSYDWVDPAVCVGSTPADQLRLAELVLDGELSAPCDAAVLYPTTGGNIHQFTAITPCAILDVLGPPYSMEEDRDCTYYVDFPYAHHLNGITHLADEQKGCLGWLKEMNVPRDLRVDCVEYGGPAIIET